MRVSQGVGRAAGKEAEYGSRRVMGFVLDFYGLNDDHTGNGKGSGWDVSENLLLCDLVR